MYFDQLKHYTDSIYIQEEMTIERFENNNLYCQITILNPLMNVANVMFFPLLKKKVGP